ncbi:MAG TPA: hypothetical protein VFC44_07775 [Candidatus Saccharimonadales bacterium]|nr:hypothetical protein [Candidatus Saccharimonadales bacterium]
MKTKLNYVNAALVLLALSALNSQLSTAHAQGTAFTYQGHLVSGANAANGNYDLTFELFNASSGGSQVGSTFTILDVGVTNGLFTVTADFGAVYSGAAYWLQIGLRTNGGSGFTALSPRQELTPVPYSVTAQNVTGAIALTQLPAGLVTNNETNVAFVNLTLSSNLNLPSSVTINSGGNTLLFSDDNNNFYAGPNAGFSPSAGNDNTGIGRGSLQNNNNGTNNTAIGYQSLDNNTNGSYNTASGERALASNTSGNDNTADGRHALENNTIGTDNTADGYQSLANNNGSFNTADGSSALSALISGSYNIALGYLAGSNYGEGESSNILIGSLGVGGDNNTIRIGSAQTETYIAGVINGNGGGLSNILSGSLINSTGSQSFFAGQSAGNQTMTGAFNTGVGDDALSVNSSGGANSAVGFKALWKNTNGSGNTALGSDVLAFNTSGNNNTATGLGALEYNNANDNTAYGAYALNNNGSGFQNTAVGYGALSTNTSGSYNTATGVGALGNNTASYNAAFGGDALALNTSGLDNAAVGASALAFNQTGSSNTAVGYAALALNTSGANNTAVGIYAMGRAISSSGANTAIGGMSLSEITDGYNNTAAGYEALQADSTGVDNVGIGVATFQMNSAGSANTACGTYAFQYLTAGNGNIGLGYSAGSGLDTGTNNIYIGNDGAANENETIRIGSGQTRTYISGALELDGSTAYNGLTYSANALLGPFPGDGPFLYGYNGGALGTTDPTGVSLSWDFSGNVWVSNNLSTASITIRGGSDLAEPFKITSGKDEVPEGSVVVIDEENPGRLKMSSLPYDTRVAGILSGANGVHPGIQMQQEGTLEGGRNVALTGRVYVQADASNGPIKPGDLLTTSSAPGRAMKVTDHVRAQGAILGKAMTGLKAGKGMVLVLVTLQ